MESSDAELAARIELHASLERQGPGDESFTRRMLQRLPPFPVQPRMADLGCGTGAAALVLAEWFGAPVTAVDLLSRFLDELNRRAREMGLAHLIHSVEADMGTLDWPAESLDLLWSEGAAYHLTLHGALARWRPLLATGGLAVISEFTWFTDNRPEPAREFWHAAYPSAGDEAENAARAEDAGFEVLAIERLPQSAWWDHYYDPLERRMLELRSKASAAMRHVIAETEAEIVLFRRYGQAYGYAFYVLRAV